MFNKILVANRGEIAVRVIRACREMKIKSAAVYSDADKTALHPRLADEAYYIGDSAASESYLNMNKIIDLAKTIGADAIHPGYGFFSENADFIEQVEKAGITFIGPSSSSVRAMGSKTAARKLVSNNGVPVVPGTVEPIVSTVEGIKTAEGIGYPVLLKASAGGGGKGMRKVSSSAEFKDAFEGARREALKAFADDAVYIEKFIEKPKHIEVQLIGDKHGNYIHLFERECSIQRRHQKIIEEAPSAFVDENTREALTEAAIKAARACGYYNAGTIEFLMDEKKSFYFLEMNTRLQVEHPVTENISGIDLVKEQISVAAGNRLTIKQSDLFINGSSIECRIYAEDPDNNFLPSTGKLVKYDIPAGPGIRVDSGFTTGSEITVYYDPLIAKLVTWGRDRNSAIMRMERALSEFLISGVIHNISFLSKIIMSSEFESGNYDINFVENTFMKKKLPDTGDDLAIAASVFAAFQKSKTTTAVKSKSASPNKWIEQQYE